jgi:NadR type nicotinamide-nucleotide adenylyltransferase
MNADVIKEVSSVKKIAIVGPECTGKTWLSMELARHYQTEWVREYARGYLDKMVRPYEQHDLLTIAQGQMLIEDEFLRDANRVLLCDTNLLVIKIWSEVKYKTIHPWILNEMAKRKYDLHLLTYIDVPWEDDPQREHPDFRNELFTMYKNELDALGVPYTVIKGSMEERLVSAQRAIDNVVMNG